MAKMKCAHCGAWYDEDDDYYGWCATCRESMDAPDAEPDEEAYAVIHTDDGYAVYQVALNSSGGVLVDVDDDGIISRRRTNTFPTKAEARAAFKGLGKLLDKCLRRRAS